MQSPAGEDVIARFEAQVARTPEATAVVCGAEALTFGQLDTLARRLARMLTTAGIGPEQRVAVALPRSKWSVVAPLAVWMADAVYLPLDPNYPAARVAWILRDAAPSAVLIVGRPSATLVESGLPLLVASEAAVDSDPGTVRTRLPERSTRDGRYAAYIIYTSGTTGHPKGVMVERRALTNLLGHFNPSSPVFAGPLGELGERPLRLSQSVSWSFDASLAPLMWMLQGNELHVLDDGVRMNPKALIAYLRRHAIDHLDVTPTQAGWLLRHGLAELYAQRRLLLVLGGEPVPETLWRELAAQPNIMAFNAFGPTEATVEATAARVAGTVVNIGGPIAGVGTRILDSRLKPVPQGEIGELYLTGNGLARGYRGRPATTAERFVADPFGPPGTRMYRTGDLVGETGGNTLLYAGRADEQVKIRGFRVEPGEIEAALGAVPGLGQVAVVAVPADNGGSRLVCYATPDSGATAVIPAPEFLRAHLARRLPRYMVPEEFVIREDLPRTANDKLDRVALRRAAPARGPAADGGTTDSHVRVVPAPADRAAIVDLLRAVFAEVLDLDEVAAGDRFIELGGDSIVAMQLATRTRLRGLSITSEDILQLQSPADLAPIAVPIGTAIEVVHNAPEEGPLPPTPIMCWLRDIGEHFTSYRQSAALRTPAGMNESDVVRLMDRLLRRHGALRLCLEPLEGDVPWTVAIAPAATVDAGAVVAVVDISLTARTALPALLAEHEAGHGRCLDPWKGRMIRATWFDAGPAQSGKLLLTIHHLAIDGVSWRIIQQELRDSGFGGAEPMSTVASVPAVSFQRWARLLAEEAVRPGREQELGLWISTLDCSDPPLASRALDPALDTVATAQTVTVGLPTATTNPLLTSVPAAARLQINDILLAALGVAIMRWREKRWGITSDTVLIDLEGHGREPLTTGLDLSATVGWFTSVFPVLLDLGPVDCEGLVDGRADWLPVLCHCSDRLRAIPDRGVGYGLLRYMNSDTGPELARYNQPQICLNYLGRMGTAADIDWNPVKDSDTGFGLLSDRSDSAMPLAHTITIDALTRDESDGPYLDATFTWAENLLAESDVQALAENWLEALDSVVRSVRKPLAGLTPDDVPLVALTQAEINLVQAAWKA